MFLSLLLAVQVAAAFLPISSAPDHAESALVGVICTSEGMQKVTLPGAETASPVHAALHGHCPLCILAADLPALADAGGAMLRIAVRLRARHDAASQMPVRFGGRPDAIRAPPRSA